MWSMNVIIGRHTVDMPHMLRDDGEIKLNRQNLSVRVMLYISKERHIINSPHLVFSIL